MQKMISRFAGVGVIIGGVLIAAVSLTYFIGTGNPIHAIVGAVSGLVAGWTFREMDPWPW